MNLKNKIADRYNILVLVLILISLALVSRLAVLTIAKGDHYRNRADNLRLREIPITAARGEIRDRNGKLIAGNRSSFTVQVIKEEINNKDMNIRNHNLLSLVRVLEEDGVSYLDNFPIELNVFKYASYGDYKTEEKKPMDKVLDLIKNNELMGKLLNKYYINRDYEGHYSFSIGERAIQALVAKGIRVPIHIEYGEGVDFIFDQDVDIDSWKKENGFYPQASAKECLLSLLSQHENLNREIIDHSIARMLVYEELVDLGLAGNIVMEEYSLSYDEEYRLQKINLMEKYDFVTEETSGEEDFLNIFKEESLENLLRVVSTREDALGREVLFAPGEELVKLVKKENRRLKFDIEIDKEENIASYIYKGREEFPHKSGMEILIDQANSLKVLDEFLKMDSIRPFAQRQLLADGVNTKIARSKGYEYVAINNKKGLYEKNQIEMDSTAEEAFNKLIEKNEIDRQLSRYEARGILVLKDNLSKQGPGYAPLNIAYGVKDRTVAKIEEGMADIPGINISIEPIRYYPEHETAAHILGYLGRISQQDEIEEYVEGRGYSPDDIIGKTGIEQSFEEELRGQNGKRIIEVDAVGNTTNIISEEKPVPGNNIYLSIDLDLQKKAEESLEESLRAIKTGSSFQSRWGNVQMSSSRASGPYRNANSGSTVAVDVNTGEVLALANYPSYDPNLFATGISSSDWASLFPENEEDQLAPRPLYNIATQTAIQPGSVYKMATALAGMEKGLSPYKQIYDGRYVSIGNDEFSCHIRRSGGSHGLVDVQKALEVSCNYYFYSLALGMDQKRGEGLGMKLDIEDIIDMSTQLGLNDKTGIEINIPSERYGGVPNPARKEQTARNMLKNFLRNNLDRYTMDGQPLEEAEKEAKIETIASWIEEDNIGKVEIARRLEKMDIIGDKRLEGEREDLADTIKYTYFLQSKWSLSDTINVTIGQGYGEYTPIQMANYVATLVNGGYRNKLTLIDNIKNYNNSELVYKPELERTRLELSDFSYLDHIKAGMLRVSKSSSGTGRRTFSNFPVNVGTKTGTAQKAGKNPVTKEDYDDFAWFVGFAPYEEPEIAIASVIFQGGSGGNAGPLTREIIAEYLGLNSKEDKDELPFKNRLVE